MKKTYLPLFAAILFALTLSSSADDVEGETYVDDRDIKNTIQALATELIEAGNITDNDELQEQLQRRHAAIDAPPEAELTEDGEEIYERAAEGVLIIAGIYLCEHCDNYHANCASGFTISEDGLAITNHHVVENTNNLTLVAWTHDGRVVPVLEVLASNEADDVALIRLGGDEPFTALPIARDAEVGQRVHAITHPDGRFYYYSSGEVARFCMQPQQRGPSVRRMQITADYARGSSGGPILNDLGQVVGMVSTTNSIYYNENDGQQENFQMVMHNCVPYESILELFAGDAD